MNRMQQSIRLEAEGTWTTEAASLETGCSSPPPPFKLQAQEDKPWRQDFGEAAAGCWGGDFAMHASYCQIRYFLLSQRRVI